MCYFFFSTVFRNLPHVEVIHSATSSMSRKTKQSSKWNLPWDAPANSTLCFKNHMSSPTLLMLNLLLCSFISSLNNKKQTFDVFNIWKHLWVRILNHSMDFSQFIGNLTCNWLHYSEKNPIVFWLIPTLGKIKTHDLHSGVILHHCNCLSRDIIYLSMSSCKTCRTETVIPYCFRYSVTENLLPPSTLK